MSERPAHVGSTATDLDPDPLTAWLTNPYTWWSAVQHGALPVVQRLLQHDPCWGRRRAPVPNHPDGPALSALEQALTIGPESILMPMVETLLPFSDVRGDEQAPGEPTPLMLAVDRAPPAVIEWLLPLSDPRATTRSGDTALMRASRRTDSMALIALLIPVSDPLAVDHQGMSAAMWAAITGSGDGSGDRVAMLLPLSNPAQRNHEGDTVLHLLAGAGMQVLLASTLDDPTIDLTVRNQQGETVVDAWRTYIARFGPGEDRSREVLQHRMQERCQAQERDALLQMLPEAAEKFPLARTSRRRL